MSKNRKQRKRPASAVLKLMQEPMFRQRREVLKTGYKRKEKHRGRDSHRQHEKTLTTLVFSHAA
ncbi:hypothetical protein [uncultured Endozoicomonas sp.]|uniref:hypothetical protein n=1 Tax=uncultured Endozoicomonas sp. TaxID=432652 RepID=UPI0026197370|nr:hypothetical protein [uncultured Endozoicomonas sp.]